VPSASDGQGSRVYQLLNDADTPARLREFVPTRLCQEPCYRRGRYGTVHDGGATVESFRDRGSEGRRVHQLDGGLGQPHHSGGLCVVERPVAVERHDGGW
jgi:hypothetical protein